MVYSGCWTIKDNKGWVIKGNDFKTPAEAAAFIEKQGKGVAPYNRIKALFIPTRTDNGKDFAKDLFLPTFFNEALRIDHVALRVFAGLGAILLDLITLLPRLVAAPFKYNYDKRQKPHEYNQSLIDLYSQLEIKIVQERSGTDAQITTCWVRTKALPEDKKLPKIKVEYGPLKTPGMPLDSVTRSVQINTLSDLKKELAQF